MIHVDRINTSANKSVPYRQKMNTDLILKYAERQAYMALIRSSLMPKAD